MRTLDSLLREIESGQAVANIGQIDHTSKLALERLVRRGNLGKWRGRWFPIPGAHWGMGPLKTCYGLPAVKEYFDGWRAEGMPKLKAAARQFFKREGRHRGRRSMTPAEFKSARANLGVSAARLAEVLQIGGGRTIRRWEAGERPVPGTVAVLMVLMLRSPAIRKFLGVVRKRGSEPPPLD